MIRGSGLFDSLIECRCVLFKGCLEVLKGFSRIFGDFCRFWRLVIVGTGNIGLRFLNNVAFGSHGFHWRRCVSAGHLQLPK